MKNNKTSSAYELFGTVDTPKPLVLIAGPCVIESGTQCLTIAKELKRLSVKLAIPVIFKASFDKANRTSIKSFRGPGLKQGLKILADVKKQTGLPILTDIHEPAQAGPISKVADIIQIPAFLCRQTDLLIAAAKTKKPVNIKKGQFMAPWDMRHSIEKVRQSGNSRVMVTERGTLFGYNNLVIDMCSLPALRKLNVPVIFDATHAVQKPGGAGASSGGQPEMTGHLARAAAAVGIDGLFLEVHPNPKKALSDAATSLKLSRLEDLLARVLEIDQLVKKSR